MKQKANSVTGSEKSTKSSSKSRSSSGASSEKQKKTRSKTDVPAELSTKDPSMIESTASEVVGAMPGSSSQPAPESSGSDV